MSSYNRFGAVYTDVVSLFPGAVADDFGGQAAIESVLDTMVEMVANSLTPQVYKTITDPDLEMIERRAVDGQTLVQLTMKPQVPGYTHIWQGQPVMFTVKPRLLTDPFYTMGVGLSASTAYAGYYGTSTEVNADQFTELLGIGPVTISNGGSGYNAVPTVVFTGTGTGAAAFATLTAGVVTAITVTNVGSGYTTPPAISFTGGAPSTDCVATTILQPNGKIRLVQPLKVNDLCFATYRVDSTNPFFSIPSLARIACRGAAAELGARLYTSAQTEWKLVEMYSQQFFGTVNGGGPGETENGFIGALRKGTMIPDEVRFMRWFEEVERVAPRGGSVRLFRG